MQTINHITTALFNVLLAPFETLPPVLTLLIWSAVTGLLMAIVFRFTSNQTALAKVAKETSANLLAIKLFQDDLSVTMKCQVTLLKSVARRLWYSLPPMLVMTVPLVFLLAQLSGRFEHAPLTRTQPVVVELELAADAWDEHRKVAITLPDGVTLETPPLRDAENHTVAWRLSSTVPDSFEAQWRFGELGERKRISVSDDTDLIPVARVRPGTDWFEQLMYPAETAFPESSPVRRVTVHYPRRTTPIFGFALPWWLTFFIVSCISALLVRPLVKVQF